MLLVPTDPLSPRRPDNHFADEAAAARELGIPVALIDHDSVAEDSARAVSRVPQQESDAVYRGWMLRSEHYGAMESALAARGVRLRTSAQAYRGAHELPGWADQAVSVTARTVWTAGFERADFEDALDRLDAREAVLRDYCKSLKHNWDEAMHIADTRDLQSAWTIAQRFLQLRDEDAVGGFVVREFEHFVGAEVRTWWVAGECVLVGAHPDNADAVFVEPDLVEISPVIEVLGHPFVSADLRQDESGRWRLIEIGDGQVSDRPRSVSAAHFVAAIS
ncbi:ATP-grasp domain-containing protein [Mycobacteroides abscessus]|uniref:ATP-grasp domain-containing protein n=1 Tax=Mycobacteroides abscessus TaxID=36809 RepID=UPI000C264801|nr:ATP-grasp domain-containing protein [Mycobacteroides abscessus]